MRYVLIFLCVATTPSFAAQWLYEINITKIDVVENGNVAISHTPALCNGISTVRGWIQNGTPSTEKIYSLMLTSYAANKKISYYTNVCKKEDNAILRAASPRH